MILSIDTFSDNFSVALLEDSKVIGCITLLKPKPFSEILMPEIDQLLVKTGRSKTKISAVVVNKGPGSNTGLRVGVTTAKTISYVLDIPLYAYISLDVMAYQFRHHCGKVIPAVNIGKGQVVYKIFEGDNQLQDTTVQPVDEFFRMFGEEEGCLIVEKNLPPDLKLKNRETLINPLSVTGGFYAVSKNLKEDKFFIEPLYHS